MSQCPKQSSKRHFLLSFLAGAGLVFAYAPFSYWFIAFPLITIWLFMLDKSPPKQAFWHGLTFGFGWFATGISWVHVSIAQFGGMHLVLSLLLMLLLCLYLAIYPGIAAWLSAKLTTHKQVNLYTLPFLWLISEWLRAHLLTGFPWLSFGYSQLDGPLSTLAPVIGETGITFVVVLCSVALYKLMKGKQLVTNLALIFVTIVGCFYATNNSQINLTGKQINVALVQGNIKQELRWDEEQEENIIDLYIRLTEDLYKNHDLILWPEAAIPRLEPLAQDYLYAVDKQAMEQQSSLITGVINYDPDARSFFNRLVVLGRKHAMDTEGDYFFRNPNHYNKHHLLPIGEFVPFQELLRPIAPLFNLPMSSFSRGDYVQDNIIANDLHIAPLICFEVAFAKQLAANMTNRTDLLLTVSNDAWFGDSHGPHQHLDIARMRALEFGRPMLRGTNNGITAVIDHKGQVIGEIPQFEEAILSTQVDLVTGKTTYSLWTKSLDKIVMILFVFFILGYKTIKRLFHPNSSL